MLRLHRVLQIDAGEPWGVTWRCRRRRNEPLDLTGASIVWTLTDLNGNVILMRTEGYMDICDPLTGVVTMSISRQVTGALAAGSYVNSLVVETADGYVSTQSAGQIVVTTLP